jgi:hypothetical protein
MPSTRPFLSSAFVHWKDGLLPIQVDLKVGAFAGFEDRSLCREPALELLARHRFIINNIVYIDKRNQQCFGRSFG